MEIQCVICDSKDTDLAALKLPIRGEMRHVGVIYCCKGCQPKVWEEIKGYADVIRLALSTLE